MLWNHQKLISRKNWNKILEFSHCASYLKSPKHYYVNDCFFSQMRSRWWSWMKYISKWMTLLQNKKKKLTNWMLKFANWKPWLSSTNLGLERLKRKIESLNKRNNSTITEELIVKIWIQMRFKSKWTKHRIDIMTTRQLTLWIFFIIIISYIL